MPRRSRRRARLPVEPLRPDEKGAALLARMFALHAEGREAERTAAEREYAAWQMRHVGRNPVMAGPTDGAVAPDELDEREAFFVRLFLRRYVAWCARRRRFAAMAGAAALWRRVPGADAR